MSAVIIENLRKQFGDHVVLPDFNLQISDGEFVVLLGPSGCGKTTVLRCVAGLEKPSAGRIEIGGIVVEDSARRLTVPAQKRGLGFVFQHYALWPHMTVHQNVAYPLRIKNTPRAEADRQVREVLSLIGLENLESRAPAELSGGQQQRVALARALVASPHVLLLDEPLSNLDAQRRIGLRKLLRDLHRQIRTSTLYVTHDQIEALSMADRVIVMRDGRIEQAGSPRDIFERPVNRFVADFLGYENILHGMVAASNGRFAAVRSPAWAGELPIESGASIRSGVAVDIAFRAANVVFHDDGNTPAPPTAVSADILDSTFLGDSIEYILGIEGSRIVARSPATGAARRIGQGRRLVSIAPENIVLLASDREHQEAEPSDLQLAS